MITIVMPLFSIDFVTVIRMSQDHHQADCRSGNCGGAGDLVHTLTETAYLSVLKGPLEQSGNSDRPSSPFSSLIQYIRLAPVESGELLWLGVLMISKNRTALEIN